MAFRDILKCLAAEKDFLTSLDYGNVQARCYALVALRSISPKIYDVQVKRFAHDKTKVSIIRCCEVKIAAMSSIVADIEAGKYDPYIKKK